MQKTQKSPKTVQNRTKTKMEKITFCVITFEPIKIQTRSAPQNDSLNFSFVKDIHVVGEKMTRIGHKMDIWASRKFWESPSTYLSL